MPPFTTLNLLTNQHFCEEVLPAFIKAITPPDKLDSYSLHLKVMTDADFELIEMKNNTFPINLDSTLTIAHLINLIDVYCNKNIKLKVTYIQNLERQESEGLAAIESVFSWLKEEIPINNIDQRDVDKLVKKLEILPNTNKVRIEFLHTTYLKWLNLQLARRASLLKNIPIPSEKNQETIKKEKEHAEDENNIRSSNRS